LGAVETRAVIAAAERRLDDMESSGAEVSELRRFIVDVFVSRNRAIRNIDFQRLDPSTVVEDYLIPRRDLYCFVVIQWIRRIFVPSLKPRVAEGLLVFGLGRLFSSYNDMGVQHCTDVDLNVVARDGMSSSDLVYLRDRMAGLKAELQERFGVCLEIDPAFTVLRAKEVAARLCHDDEDVREANLRFYKSNERSICVIVDHEDIRERVFAYVRDEPDCRLFENFLGLECSGQSYAKLRSGKERLRMVAEGGSPVSAAAVIGSKAFDDYCRRLYPLGDFLSPPDWVFSMKYFVNRVYDYVGAMRTLGHSLEEIGFDKVEPRLGLDADYRYLRNAHKLMLYLQELITLSMDSFSAESDYSYISRARFLRFMEIGGDKFKRDFDDMVLKGDLLYQSDKAKYRALERKIESKSRDRYLTGKTADLALFPPDFKYDALYRDAHSYKICVPYSWGDLGYFAFSAIAARIVSIVEGRLVPRLPYFEASDGKSSRPDEALAPQCFARSKNQYL
jgi:hypothetical protein